jgi:hypothetical protein
MHRYSIVDDVSDSFSYTPPMAAGDILDSDEVTCVRDGTEIRITVHRDGILTGPGVVFRDVPVDIPLHSFVTFHYSGQKITSLAR